MLDAAGLLAERKGSSAVDAMKVAVTGTDVKVAQSGT